MKSRIPLVLTALMGLALMTARTAKSATDVADAIYYGNIVTINDAQPTAEALAVKDGKILAVGSRDNVNAYKGDATKIFELADKALLPGFLDAHSHYISSLTVANQLCVYPSPAGPGNDRASIVAALRNFLQAKYPDGNIPQDVVIQAYGYDDTAMPSNDLLTRWDLDGVSNTNPVIVGHVSMHGAVMNSAALTKWSITKDTVTPDGGVIVRDSNNEPIGLIMETAYEPVFKDLPKPQPGEDEINCSHAGQMLYAQAGITTAQEGATHAKDLYIMDRVAQAGKNIIDIIALPFITDLDNVLKAHPVSDWGKYNNHLKIGGVKITIDGSPQGRTAYFSTPYLTGGPNGQLEWRGELMASQDFINKGVKNVYDLNVPLFLHANGDAAIDSFFQAHVYAAAGDLEKDRRVTLIHAQFTRKDQLDKYKKYIITPSFYTLHTYYFARAHIANRGWKQAHYISPMRDAIDKGLRPTNHTDFVVAPLDQMFMLWSAVNRISRENYEIGPDQRVTPLEGLKAMTINVAYQYGEQDLKGSLEPGKLADLVVLDKNPLKVDPKDINRIKVVETIKEGKMIYSSLQSPR
ncbi:MAG: amidohydrolase [Isosphaeraceae bacterium]